tara:strand:- start:2925 stop:3221 length:297 start_codon:yes stop_codon:yes gene_type:complete
MLVKIHKSYRWVVAICDSDLLGKKFKEGNKQLDMTGNFFKGEEKNKDELRLIIEDCEREDATFFIVGKESVAFCKELGLILDEGVKEVSEVPVALTLL